MAMSNNQSLGATARAKQVREGAQSKQIEQYREQHEQMHIRALSAEMEAASAKLKLQNALEKLKSQESLLSELQSHLASEKLRNTENDVSLGVAKGKISKLKSKLKVEFDKILNNQKDIRVGVNSFLRCVYEYRRDAISKEDFFCAVDLIFTSLLSNDTAISSPIPIFDSTDQPNMEVFFNSSSLQELVSLPPEQRRKKLELFIDRLSPEKLFAQTSDRLLSYVFDESSATPPPLPAKPTRFQKRVPHESSQTPPPIPHKPTRKIPVKVANSDSDSDFEGNDEIQRIRRTNRTSSEPSLVKIGVKKTNSSDGRLKSSNLLTSNVVGGKHKRQNLRRSKSLDHLIDGDVPSSGVTELPQRQLEVWHQMVGVRDSSVLTGSLPRLNVIEDETEDVISYVTPNEFRAMVNRAKEDGNRISHRASMRVMQRFDSLVQSYYSTDYAGYIRLISDRRANEMSWIKNQSSKKQKKSPRKSGVRKKANYENHVTMLTRIPNSKSSSFSDSPSLPNRKTSTDVPPLPAKKQVTDEPIVISSSKLPLEASESMFDDPVYDAHPRDSTHIAKITPLSGKPHLVNIEFMKGSTSNGNTNVPDRVGHPAAPEVGDRPPASLPRPPVKPKPLPKRNKNIASKSLKSPSGNEGSNKFPDQIPTYWTLKRNMSLRLVPILPYGATGGTESEEDPGDYSLGTFKFTNEGKLSPDSLHTKDPFQSNEIKMSTKASSSDTDEAEVSDGYETPPDATRGYIEPRSSRDGMSGRDRSYTANLVSRNRVIEKQGYMEKLDPSLKHLTKRWFVLKGKELKYFSKMKSRKPKGVINLETWCKISRHEMTNSFQLATPSRTYHFLADSNTECEEWIKALQTVMRLCQNGGSSGQPEDAISGYMKLVMKNTRVLKCWVSIIDQVLHVYQSSSDSEPIHMFSLVNALIRYGADVPSTGLAHISKCSSLPFGNKEEFSINIEMSGAEVNVSEDDEEETITLILSNKEERELWFYHLISASSSDTGPELTLTEKLVTRLWRSAMSAINQDGHHGQSSDDAALWSNPLLNHTSEPIHESLLSHPSTALTNEAVEMFKLVSLFIMTPFDSLALDYHIITLQQLVSKCLSSPGLRDELYCQILRQISSIGHRAAMPSHSSLQPSNVLQGWFMLSLLIPLFIPTRKIFQWYLEAVLLRVSKGKVPEVVSGMTEAAQVCHQRFLRAKDKGPREKTPSWFEMHSLMSGPVHISRFMLSLKLKLPVNLMNDTTLLMEFDSSTEVQEFISHLNQEIGMPDSETTGFALMSDWPGEDDEAGFYLFPSNKLCDVISTWYECLSDISSTTVHTRNIQLTYRKRLHFKLRRGLESDKEALLLTYQISKDVLNEYYYVGKVDLALDIAARMSQIDYGDCSNLKTDQQQVARDAIRRFCPIKFTKMILPHDMDAMVDRMLSIWKGYQGTNRHVCARTLLSLFADNWTLFGSTVFYCTDRYSVLTNVKNGAIWLAIHENGVTLMNPNYLVKPIVSYSYKEVATFGGHSDDFMLVVNSRRVTTQSVSMPFTQTNSQESVHNTEKIILSMSKLKIREATYLMASYLDSFGYEEHQ